MEDELRALSGVQAISLTRHLVDRVSGEDPVGVRRFAAAQEVEQEVRILEKWDTLMEKLERLKEMDGVTKYQNLEN